jgi:glycosyltransferase involved in cell wall biosynthesis
VKLLFFISSLQCGGAERVCATLSNHWADRGWEVILATFDDGSAAPFFPLSPRVRHVTLGLQRRSTGVVHSVVNNLRRLPRLRRLVRAERPERILSFIDATNVLALLAARGTGIPVVVSERIDPAHHPIPAPWRVLRRLTYPWAHAIAIQTRTAAAYFPPSWRSRIAVLPNPVPDVPPGAGEPAAPRPGRRTIVAMGRLERQKGFDLLIPSFASIARERPDWDLTILGEGGEREALEAQVERTGLTGRVALPGREPDAASVLRRADLFVLSSRYEGFPNALCEAMACGLPVISFDCPSGPSDIIRDGIDGRLVPAEDVSALGAAMFGLTGDEAVRRSLGARASEVAARFSLPKVAALWAGVLEHGAPWLEPAGADDGKV